MLGYIAVNLAESRWIERQTVAILRQRNITAELVVPSPPPFAFWRRAIAWRSADRYGYGNFDLRSGLSVDPGSSALTLDDPRLVAALRGDAHVRGFFSWSRMPIVVVEGDRAFLGDQRYSGSSFGRSNFLIPLDSGRAAP